MKELNFEEEKLKVSYAGEVCEIRLPSYEEEISYLAKIEKKELGANEIVKLTEEYYLSLGMSLELFKKLPTKYIKEISKALSDNEKK